MKLTVCEKIQHGDGFVIVCRLTPKGKHKGMHGRKYGCYMRKICERSVLWLCDGPADKSIGVYLDEDGNGRCSAPICEKHGFTQPDGSHLCWHHERARLAAEKGQS